MKKRFKNIYIEITNICNLSCTFCPKDNRKKEYMSVENFSIILDKIKPYTDYIYLHVKGEPLIHSDINEFIEIAYKKGFKTNITTNGTLIDSLHNKNIRQINYSMHSIKNIHEIKNIIKKLKEFIKNTKIILSLRLWTIDAKNNLELKNLLLEMFPLIKTNNDLKNKDKLDTNIFLSIEDEFEWPDINCQNSNDKGYCYGLKSHIAILVDGNVIPCCLDHRGKVILGNILHQSLEEILSLNRTKEIIQGFKNRIAVEALCQKCSFKNKF